MYKGKFSWPNGAHIAVVFNMSWETWPKTLGTSRNNQVSGEALPPGAKYARGMRWIYEHAYAETGGMQRLLDVWQRYGIKSSCYADGLTVSIFPDLAREVAEQGHEYIVQGWDHGFMWELTVKEQEESIDKTIKAFKDVMNLKATGFSSSGGMVTAETFPLCAERGFKYVCGLRNVDVPFIIRIKNKKLVGMNSYAVTDFEHYKTGIAPREVVHMWKSFFDTLYEEGQRGCPQMLAYGTHPFLGHGFRTRELEHVIKYVQSKPNVWIATRGEIADWVLKNYPEMDLSKFYPESAVASDRWYGLGIGLGGKEAEEEALSYRKE